MDHVLIIGDFVRLGGFQRVNEAIAGQLRSHGWRVSVLAINYSGDPTHLQADYALYPAGANGSDPLGVARLPHVIAHARPDVLLFVNDPWVVDDYMRALPDDAPPAVAYLPVDGPGMNPDAIRHLGRLDTCIAYTAFGAQELRRAGVAGPIPIIPHGVATATFAPLPQADARAQLGIPPDIFGVLLCDANQWRKRHDLAIAAFARFAADVPAARLLLHSPRHTPYGWDLGHLITAAGLDDRVITSGQHGRLTDAALRLLYCAADVRLSATMGEGWGLTIHEAMACGVPVIAPRYAALGEWAADGAYLVDVDPEITDTYTGGHNTRGGGVRPSALAAALRDLFDHPDRRRGPGAPGDAGATQPPYDWAVIGAQFHAILQGVVASRRAVWVAAAASTLPHTRPNTIDAWVWEQVVTHNEYGIGDLAAHDRVIDIGGHIGSFAYLAYQRGSRNIAVYEPDTANLALIARNLAEGIAAGHVTVDPCAVWRSDWVAPVGQLRFTGHDGKNTGAGNVVFGDGEQRLVPAVALDAIIGDGPVALLKIDAESAEWPILFTSQRLHQVQRIVGEYHEVGGAHDTNTMTDALRVGDATRYTAADLQRVLEAHGFVVDLEPYLVNGQPSNLGAFRAIRVQTIAHLPASAEVIHGT